MKNDKIKIIITNTVVCNGGDAAILKGILSIVKDAFGDTVQIMVYDSQPDIAARYYPGIDFRHGLFFDITCIKNRHIKKCMHKLKLIKILWFWLQLNRFKLGARLYQRGFHRIARFFLKKSEFNGIVDYSQADCVISTGGTYLVENYDLSPRIFDYKICMFFKRPLFFFPQSIGQFNQPKNKKAFKEVFDYAHYILVRGHKSLLNLVALGVDAEKIRIVPDAAFALYSQKNSVVNSNLVFKRTLRVAVSVRDWDYFRNNKKDDGMNIYLTFIKKTIVYLIKRYDVNITLISTCQGISEYWKDDSVIGERIIKDLPKEYHNFINLDSKFHHPEELIKLLTCYDIAIATRMHFGILALIAGIPVLPIGYEFKSQEVFNRYDYLKSIQDIETLDVQLMIKDIERLLENKQYVCDTISVRNAEHYWKVMQISDILKSSIITQVD